MRMRTTREYYAILRERVIAALGDAFEVDPIDRAEPCDVSVILPEGTGMATICLERRQWCMGGRMHARLEQATWFGVRCSGYSGRAWPEALAKDLRESFVRAIQDDLDEFEQEVRNGNDWRSGAVTRYQRVLTRLGKPRENWREEYRCQKQ